MPLHLVSASFRDDLLVHVWGNLLLMVLFLDLQSVVLDIQGADLEEGSEERFQLWK